MLYAVIAFKPSTTSVRILAEFAAATGNFRKVATSLIDKLPHIDATRTFVLQQVCMLAELRTSARLPHCFRRARLALDGSYSISAWLCFILSAPHRPLQNTLRRLFTASLWIAVCFPRTRQGPVCFPLHDRSSLARTRAVHSRLLLNLACSTKCMFCSNRKIRLRECTRRQEGYRAWASKFKYDELQRVTRVRCACPAKDLRCPKSMPFSFLEALADALFRFRCVLLAERGRG